MKKLLIDRKKFINWYLGDSDDVMGFAEAFVAMQEGLIYTGAFSVTAQSILESVISFMGSLPERVLSDGQTDYSLDDSEDVILEGYDLITFNSDLVEPVIDITGASTDDLKKELESRGYFTENLWHVDDVESQLAYYNEEHLGQEKTIDHSECLTILGNVMTDEWIIEKIFESIYNEISE